MVSVFNNWVTKFLPAPAHCQVPGRQEGRALLPNGKNANCARECRQGCACTHTHMRSRWQNPLDVFLEGEVVLNPARGSMTELSQQQIMKYLCFWKELASLTSTKEVEGPAFAPSAHYGDHSRRQPKEGDPCGSGPVVSAQTTSRRHPPQISPSCLWDHQPFCSFDTLETAHLP